MKYKTCSVCKRDKTEKEFIKGNSPFLPGNYSIICTGCLETLAPAHDFNAVDRLMRWLDIPFYVGQWSQLYKMNGEHTLGAYVSLLSSQKDLYEKANGKVIDWTEINEKWVRARENKSLDREIPELSAEWVSQMKKVWPGNYSREDYESLESLYDGLRSAYPITAENQKREARQMCMMSRLIDKRIEKGEDVSKEIKSYLELKKAGGFEAKDAKNITDFDSIGEVLVWLGKKGFQPSFANETKDVVDLTMHGIQDYLRRVVLNEPTLADQVEQRKASYDLSKKMEEFDNSENFKKFEESNIKVEFEGAEELDSELGDFYGQ